MAMKQPISRTISYLFITTFAVLWWILSKKYTTWNLQTFRYITSYEWQFFIYPHKRDGSTIASSTVSLIRLFVPIAICLMINSILFFTNRKFRDFVKTTMITTHEGEVKWYHWFTKSNLQTGLISWKSMKMTCNYSISRKSLKMTKNDTKRPKTTKNNQKLHKTTLP